MLPNLPELSKTMVLMALQSKPMYEGTALPKDARRRAKRVKRMRRDAERMKRTD